ncbi:MULTISPECIES: FAD-dependent oxidoreductase [unclassified Romboutsia]|uniref:FAD-dependent oxidoreductase n=1 Tax=unclassified Romboutsia TaxID=2626894 RepID=UPI000820C7CC|nr:MULTISPECIES: FAD-dependent oxidoreductase [unclassified Romboutsia]SCI40477.1 NAD-dependent dihydropyrimidine dehydrogenase sunbunit PreT [uncultured Clostridium sp.]
MNNVGYLTESGKYFTKEEAISEAKRCLLCEASYCSKNCPIEIDPKYIISLVAEERIDEAVKVIRERNPLAAICSRVCPYETYCVGGCKNTELKEPIMIPYIEKFLTEYEKESNWKISDKKIQSNSNGKKVAIIGSGPSGLAASAILARIGYDVTVIEAREGIGGWLTYGIPPHRLPKHAINQDVEYIKSLGVKFRTNTLVGKDVTLDALREEGFDAFLLSSGLNKGRVLKIKGSDLDGVLSAVNFLAEAKSKDGHINVGKSAVIIGGGDVAMDCGTTAKLTGYEKVRVVVRTGIEEMNASQKELNYLKFVNVPIFDHFDSVEILGDENNKVRAIEFKGTDDSSDLILEADTIIFAVGQMSDGIQSIAPVELDQRGTVITNDFQTSIEDVFATGDIIQGQKTACFATSLGKKVAEAIDAYLRNK